MGILMEVNDIKPKPKPKPKPNGQKLLARGVVPAAAAADNHRHLWNS